MFGGFNINIYSKGKCYLDCYYCNMIKQDPTIKESDLLDFIKNNIHSINKDSITISGGEPLVDYSIDFYKTIINLGFKKLLINTNLLNTNTLDEMLAFIRENDKYTMLNLRVSYNGPGDSTRDSSKTKENILKYTDFISQISMVVNSNTQYEIFEVAKLAKESNRYFSLSPQLNNGTEFGNMVINEDVLKNELDKIWKNNLYPNLINYLKIESGSKGNLEKCTNENIYISPNGNISTCEYTNDIYYSTMSDKDIIGNIKTVKNLNDLLPTMVSKCTEYKDLKVKGYYGDFCHECKKCSNWKCSVKSINKKTIEENYCLFNKVFYDYVNKEAKFRRDIARINLFMTEKCNMNCTYCFEEDYKNRLGNVDNEVIKKTIDILLESETTSSKELQLFGGEPSLNINGILFLAEYYNSHPLRNETNKIIFSITTNMLSLSDNLIEAYDQLALNTKLKIGVSLDSLKEIHDINRIDLAGKGTYETVTKNVEKYYNHINKKYGTSCYFHRNIELSRHTVMTKDDVERIDLIVSNMFELCKIFDYQFFAHVNGEGDVMIQDEDITKLVSRLYEIHDSLDDDKKKELMKDYFSAHMDSIRAIHDFSKFNVCTAGDTMLGIRANGDILPCHAFINKIDDKKYNETVLIDNILKIKEYPYIMFSDKTFIFKDLTRKVNSGTVKIKTVDGKDCSTCYLKEVCNTCLAFVEIEEGTIIKKEEYCMRTFNNSEILLKIKEVKELEKFNNKLATIESDIKNIYRGVGTLGDNIINLKTQVDANSESIIEIVESI